MDAEMGVIDGEIEKREKSHIEGWDEGRQDLGWHLSSAVTHRDSAVILYPQVTQHHLSSGCRALCPQRLDCRSLNKDTKTCRCSSPLHKMLSNICLCLPLCVHIYLIMPLGLLIPSNTK